MISIVIVSYNAVDHLRTCLATVYEHQRGEFELVVVDNDSPDDSADMVEREFPGVRLIRNRTNAGFAAGVNTGLRASAGDVIVMLNPDSVLTEDAFSAPAAYLREHADVGALGIKILDPDGKLQLSVRRFPGLEAALFNRYSIFTRLLPHNRYSRRYLMTDWQHDTLSDVDWVSGACLLTTRVVIDRVGHLDEGYFWGFEDVDFCQRLHKAGLCVVYYPMTCVIHAIGASARTVPTKAIVARHKGMWRYYSRHLASNAVVNALVYAGVWARCGLQVASSQLKRRLI